MDWHTRRVVGYAINLAESALATLDMLCSGIARCGMFREFYVDKGSGFDNAQVREVIDRLRYTDRRALAEDELPDDGI